VIRSESLHSVGANVEGVMVLDVGSEHERGDSSELDEDVDGGAGGILERISDGVTDNSGDLSLLPVVSNSLLLNKCGLGFTVSLINESVDVVVIGATVLNLEGFLGGLSVLLNLLLAVVPSSTSVGSRDGDLDT